MGAGDDEETSVELVDTLENFVCLYDYSHEYYAEDKKEAAWWEVTRKMTYQTFSTV
jgi:hypothetical protein